MSSRSKAAVGSGRRDGMRKVPTGELKPVMVKAVGAEPAGSAGDALGF